MPALVVSDANIVIDLLDGQIFQHVFGLPYEIIIPDIIYTKELEPFNAGLLEQGLIVRSVDSDGTAYVEQLIQRGGKLPGVNDLFALALARQNNCTLLTGDGDLRRLAAEEHVEVHGTLWVIEQLLQEELVDAVVANEAFRLMKENGCRLPEADMQALIEQYLD